jgi:catechol 2,3-dioxygenase-like lactoylglutathione lyase family enzyme
VFDHVTIRVSDLDASIRFYGIALDAVAFGGAPTVNELGAEWNDFSITPSDGEHPVTRRLHIGFAAPSRGHVDRFWRDLLAAGYRDDGEPGPRPQYRDGYYGAFVLDPDGNSAEAVHHDDVRTDGETIDHLWIRVADVAASVRFYETIARFGGYAVDARGDRAHLSGPGGGLTVVAGGPTENVHLAFAAPDRETVDGFHRVATAAGYRDNGPPGERAVYHPGYYAAFVLDPDGHNVEAVFHDRR